MYPLPLYHVAPRQDMRMPRLTRGATRPLLAVFATLLAGCTQSPAVRVEPLPVRTFIVGAESSDVSSTTGRYAGTVVARHESSVGFQVPGRLVARLADVGQHVSVGAPLARLDAQDLALGVESARATLRAADADAANAASDVARAKALHSEGILTDAALERATTSATTAVARRTDARARLTMAENSARYATLVAPITGIVTTALAETGQVLNSGQPVFVIARDGDREVAIDVPESRIAAVRAGQRAQVSMIEGDSTPILAPAVIREVAPAADPVTGTYRVRLTLHGARSVDELPLGRSVGVHLLARDSMQTVRIPSTAVVQTKASPGVWVMARTRDRVRFQHIAVDGIGDGTVIVRSGIRAGDEIVTAGTNRLDSALVVTPWNGRMP